MSSADSLDQVIRCQEVTNSLISIKKTIRLSCTASSPQYLVLGANTGSLYFFERYSLRFLQLCIFEELQEPISFVSFSPDEKMLAFATAPPHRNIYITPVPIKGRRKKDLLCITEHKAEIKCLLWGVQKVSSGSKDGSGQVVSYATILFSADDSGVVCKTQFAQSLLGSSNVTLATDVLYQADSRVNQLSFDTELNQLIVSSATCTALLDFGRGQAYKVGTKPRMGPFGSSFFLHVSGSGSIALSSSTVPLAQSILASRPGNRVWVAQPSNPAKVSQTLNFQTSLQATAPSALFTTSLPPIHALPPPNKEDLNFHKLVPLELVALLTWNQNAVFFVDIHSLKIITWYYLGSKLTGYIADVATTNSHSYVLYHKYESTSQNTNDGITQADLNSGNYTITPLLAHLTIDWPALLAWCVQALDWVRTSFILQRYQIDNLALLESIEPFMNKNAVDGNTVNDIGRLAKSQIERILKDSKAKVEQKTEKETKATHSVPSTPPPAAAPSNTDWNSFSLPNQEVNSSEGGKRDEEAVFSSFESSTAPTSLEPPVEVPKIGDSMDQLPPLEPTTTQPETEATPSPSVLTVPVTQTPPIESSPRSTEDPFDFGSSTAPLNAAAAVEKTDSENVSAESSPKLNPEISSTIVPTAPVPIKDTRMGPANPNSLSLSFGDFSTSDALSPTSSLSNSEISYPSSPVLNPAIGTDDLTASSPSLPSLTTTSDSSNVLNVTRRKKKPRAVDIASPSAKMPNAVQSSGVPAAAGAAKLSSLTSSTSTLGSVPNQVAAPASMTRSSSGNSLLSGSASSLPPFDASVISTTPVPSISKLPLGTDVAAAPGATSASIQANPSSFGPSPSITPSGSQTPTPVGSLGKTPQSTPTDVHTATQWGPESSPPSTEPSAVLTPTNSTNIVPNSIPQTAIPKGVTGVQQPQHTVSAPLPPSQSNTPTTTPVHAHLSSSTSSISKSTSAGEPVGNNTANTIVAQPPAAKTPLNVSGTQPKVSTADELKQLGRDFKNKAKEGFRSFLSSLPTSTNPTTPATAVPAPQSTLPNAQSQNLSTSQNDLPEFVPVSVQSDPLTTSTLDHLQLHRVLADGRDPITNASIYPRLKLWINHYHSRLETVPNAAQHATIIELLTACFEYEVSSPKHTQTEEWSEEDALQFVSLYLPSLRLSKVLTTANEHRWQQLMDHIVERLNQSYEHWKQENAASETSGTDSPPEDSSNIIPAKGAMLTYVNTRSEIDSLLEKSNFPAALKKTFSKGDLALILPYLEQLFESSPKDTLIACAQHYPNILPHNVEILLSKLKSTSVGTNELLHAYFVSLMEKSPVCRHNEELTCRWLDLTLSSLLQSPNSEKLTKSVPKAHSYRLKHIRGIGTQEEVPGETIEILPCKLTYLESSTFNGVWLALKDDDYMTLDRSEALKICLKNGYWRGAIMLALELEMYDVALELCISVDDKTSFERLLSITGAISARDWPKILLKSSYVRELQLSESPVPLHISSDFLVIQMSSFVGPVETVTYLNEDLSAALSSSDEAVRYEAYVSEQFISSISFSVFHQLLSDGKKGEKRKAVIARALKSFDQSMFTKRNIFFGPQIANVEFIERASVSAREHPLDHVPFFIKVETSKGVDWSPSFVVSGPTATVTNDWNTTDSATSTSATHSFLGEHGNHWGTHTHFSASSTCLRCGLPLLDQRAGKIAFFERCAHPYHDNCVEEDACPECLYASFHSLLPVNNSLKSGRLPIGQ